MAFKKGDIMGFSGKPWPQYQFEIQGFIDLLVAENVRSYLEIGCRYGDTWHAIGSALEKGSRLVALDLPGAKSGFEKKGGHQDSGDYLKLAAVDLVDQGQQAVYIIGNSHKRETIAAAQSYAPFDAILIDGDHTAAGVQADWEAYSSMGRIIAFHDIAGSGKWALQIRPIFRLLSKTLRHTTIVHDNLRRGIGVVWRN